MRGTEFTYPTRRSVDSAGHAHPGPLDPWLLGSRLSTDAVIAYDGGIEMDAAVMDGELNGLAGTLAASNPDAMTAMKQVFWAGTEQWDTLLAERARMSGTLVLSEFTKASIAKFKGR